MIEDHTEELPVYVCTMEILHRIMDRRGGSDKPANSYAELIHAAVARYEDLPPTVKEELEDLNEENELLRRRIRRIRRLTHP